MKRKHWILIVAALAVVGAGCGPAAASQDGTAHKTGAGGIPPANWKTELTADGTTDLSTSTVIKATRVAPLAGAAEWGKPEDSSVLVATMTPKTHAEYVAALWGGIMLGESANVQGAGDSARVEAVGYDFPPPAPTNNNAASSLSNAEVDTSATQQEIESLIHRRANSMNLSIVSLNWQHLPGLGATPVLVAQSNDPEALVKGSPQGIANNFGIGGEGALIEIVDPHGTTVYVVGYSNRDKSSISWMNRAFGCVDDHCNDGDDNA
jgi:hypothetical protein